MIERSGEMSSKNQDLGHSVIKAFMNFKHAEIKSFQIPGYSKSETRFILFYLVGLKQRAKNSCFRSWSYAQNFKTKRHANDSIFGRKRTH